MARLASTPPASPGGNAALPGLRVFISYPRGGATHSWAEQLHADLEQRGATVWRDASGIAEGDDDWYTRIREGLERADVVACVVGADSEGSGWQQREMLRADQLALPIVAFKTAAGALPFYIIEKQPVVLRDARAPGPSFDALAQALARAAARWPLGGSTAAAGPVADTALRQRECAYLQALLYGSLSGHAALYEPVAGQQRTERSLARSHKGTRIDGDLLLEVFQLDRSAMPDAPVQHCDDVLDVYRALPKQPIRRLAVIGEPGAGKTFSLQRIACDFARRAMDDATAPLPLLVGLGAWTREGETLTAFLERQLAGVGRDLEALRDQGRAVLLLDGLNEIPPQQRQHKAEQIRTVAEDDRFAAVVVSCRARDFEADYRLPFDTLTLQPLTPLQIHRFLHRAYAQQHGTSAGAVVAERRFWEIAGGPALQAVWEVWRSAGASLAQFWTLDEVPKDSPNVFATTSVQQDNVWRTARREARSLLRMASNPYLLYVMTELPAIPTNRARLFDGFLQLLHQREREARHARHDSDSVPGLHDWRGVLCELAAVMQGLLQAPDAGAATALARGHWPSALTPELLAFSIDASVLQRAGDDLRFSHQLLQEALASRVLRQASDSGSTLAANFWPAARWWQRNGWEVVAEIAAEGCAGDEEALWRLVRWLAQAQPEVACNAWRRAGAPKLPPALSAELMRNWLPRLTDALAEPSPLARAAIGRALGGFDLDQRPGVGLRPDGLPAIDWVVIPGDAQFICQDGEQRSLPAFEIARFPVTNRQFQAFVDAGGYADERWWAGLAKRVVQPDAPRWADPNAPRETVSWYEAVAYCRWLGDALQCTFQLPTEQQWERAARGTRGAEYPWGNGYRAGCANCDETASDIKGGTYVGRTTAVGIYPFPSAEGVHDLAGNVWEWCLNEYEQPENMDVQGAVSRVLRGGSWNNLARNLRAARRYDFLAEGRYNNVGFRVCRGSPIE
jgi:hypothetical protein